MRIHPHNCVHRMHSDNGDGTTVCDSCLQTFRISLSLQYSPELRPRVFHQLLTNTEEFILISLKALGPSTKGMEVKDHILRTTNVDFLVTTVYSCLKAMEAKRYISWNLSRLSNANQHPVKSYSLTSLGESILKDQESMREAMRRDCSGSRKSKGLS